ncbi:MAG: DUF6515 family protein [Saonia sp.]
MKNLKAIVIGLILFGALFSTNAQSVVKVYPKQGTVVTTIHKPKIVVHRGINYHFSDGVWYKTRGKNYVVCAPLAGITVRSLPRGKKVVIYKGRKLYKYKGIWYKKRGRGYAVVNV